MASCGLVALLSSLRSRHADNRRGVERSSNDVDARRRAHAPSASDAADSDFKSQQRLQQLEQIKPLEGSSAQEAPPATLKISRDSWSPRPQFDGAAQSDGATQQQPQNHVVHTPQSNSPAAAALSHRALDKSPAETQLLGRFSGTSPTQPPTPSSSSSAPLAGTLPAQHAAGSFDAHLQTIMQQAPCLLTTLTADGSRVLFQNSASKDFYGDLTADTAAEAALLWDHGLAALAASAVHEQLPCQHQQLLERLFSLNGPGALEEMLGNMARGLPWRKVMQVEQQLFRSGDPDGADLSSAAAWSQASTENAVFASAPENTCAADSGVSSLDLQRPTWDLGCPAPAPVVMPALPTADAPLRAAVCSPCSSVEDAAAGPIASSVCTGAAGAAAAEGGHGWMPSHVRAVGGSKSCGSGMFVGKLVGGGRGTPQEAARKQLLPAAAAPALPYRTPGAAAAPALGCSASLAVPLPPTPPQPDAPATWHWQKPLGGKGLRTSLSLVDLAGAALEAAGADADADAAAAAFPNLHKPSSGDPDIFRMSTDSTGEHCELPVLGPEEVRLTPALTRAPTPAAAAPASRGPSLDDGSSSSRSCSLDSREGRPGAAAGSPFTRRSDVQMVPAAAEDWRRRRSGIELSDLLVSPPSRTMSMMQFANHAVSPTASFASTPTTGRPPSHFATFASGSFGLRTSSSGGGAAARPERHEAAPGGWSMHGCTAAAAAGVPACLPPAAAPQNIPPPLAPAARLSACAALDSCDNRGSASSIASVPENHPMAFHHNARASAPEPGSPPHAAAFHLASLSASPAHSATPSFVSAKSSAGPLHAGAAGDGHAACGPGAAGAAGAVWHDVVAQALLEPGCSAPMILLTQFDVTSRVQAENCLAWLSERQLSMLSGIFPRHVIEFLSVNSENLVPKQIATLARTHHDVTILFMDICGFTTMAKQIEPETVMSFLNSLFTTFDSMCDEFGVQKVETAGDCYIAAAGILSPDDDGFSVAGGDHDAPNSAQKLLRFAKAMLAASRNVIMPHNGENLKVRIGLHTGPCVSGLVGTKLPKFSLFGDTMNTASRMESTCTPGHIQASEATWKLLQVVGEDATQWQAMSGVQVKGKGLMKTFTWLGDAAQSGGGVEDAGSAEVPSSSRDSLGVPPPQPFARPASRLGSPSCSNRSSGDVTAKAERPNGDGSGAKLDKVSRSSPGASRSVAGSKRDGASGPVRFHLKISDSAAPTDSSEPEGLKVPAWEREAVAPRDAAEPAPAMKKTLSLDDLVKEGIRRGIWSVRA